MHNGKKEITVPAEVNRLPEIIEFIEDFMSGYDVSPKTQIQIDVAADEIFTNIASYAYAEGGGNATVSIEMTDNPSSLEITFKDFGIDFNPLNKSDPDVTLSAEDRQIGGLGIYMVKKSMDEVSYERTNGENILKIKKNI